MSKFTQYLQTKLEAWVEFEGLDGFEVEVAYLSREELNKIRKACTRTAFSPATRQKEEVVDNELFVSEFVKASVLNWKGLTLDHASTLMPLKFPEGTDLAAQIDFDHEAALELTKNSPVFDGWLNDVIFNLSNFR